MNASDDAASRYCAFISYSHKDAACARWLHRALEAYRTPRELVGASGDWGPVPRGLTPIFRDEEELRGSAQLAPELQSALDGSGALIVVCSPAASASVWVDREIRRFKTTNPSRPVFAIVAGGVTEAAEACFPRALKLNVSADGALAFDESLEPLAPDLNTHGHRVVKLKLAAGLLGVSYDKLVNREERRRRRRLTAVGALAAVVIVALSVLSITALTYARVAVEQRNLAQQARALAERNAVEAERKAWLANAAAEALRSQLDMDHAPKRP